MLATASIFLQLLAASSLVFASPTSRNVTKRGLFSGSSSTIDTPHGKFTGYWSGRWKMEYWYGVPYAKPPTGNLRLRPPEHITEDLGDVNNYEYAPGCPQREFHSYANGLLTTIFKVWGVWLLDEVPGQEDCLTLDIQRPTWTGSTEGKALPVVVYMHGGGFDQGGSQLYDAGWIQWQAKEPFIFVAINYRLGGFGFLPGKEVLRDGAANLGLLDQRMALQWIQDNIAYWNGDPDQVTLWGQSAGSICAFDQLALYDGKIEYNGKQLFRSAILSSGTIVPAEPVDSDKAQAVYDKVVEEAGCQEATDTLDCLRGVDYDTLLKAVRSNPNSESYSALALSYFPRPDGTVLRESPEVLLQRGQFTKVPMIVGEVEDEGTLFASTQTGVNTTEDIVQYLHGYYFPNISMAELTEYVETYPSDPKAGSPYRSDWVATDGEGLPPAYKRIASILGDLVFEMPRRVTLDTINSINSAEEMPIWSYMTTFLNKSRFTPQYGTPHGSDILTVFNRLYFYFDTTYLRSYISNFILNQNPNTGNDELPNWERYNDNQRVMEIGWYGNTLENWNPRQDSEKWIQKNLGRLQA